MLLFRSAFSGLPGLWSLLDGPTSANSTLCMLCGKRFSDRVLRNQKRRRSSEIPVWAKKQNGMHNQQLGIY